MCHNLNLGSASDWMKQIFHQSDSLPRFEWGLHEIYYWNSRPLIDWVFLEDRCIFPLLHMSTWHFFQRTAIGFLDWLIQKLMWAEALWVPWETPDISRHPWWFPMKWLLRSKYEMGASKLMKQISNQSEILPRCHQYGISALISQMLFPGETTDGIANCLLLSQATLRSTLAFLPTTVPPACLQVK